MSDFLRHVMAGFTMGQAAKRGQRADEKWEYEKGEHEEKKRQREEQRAGNEAFQGFLQDLMIPQEELAASNPVNSGFGPSSPSPGPGVVDPRQGPATSYPISMNDRSNAQPLSEGAPTPGQANPVAAGITAAPVGEQSQFSMPSIEKAPELMQRVTQIAMKHPGVADRVNQWKDSYRKAALQQHQKGFVGDLNTLAGLRAYSEHMAKGMAAVGDYVTPEQARERYKDYKEMEKEGYFDALEKFDVGDLQGGINALKDSGRNLGEVKGYEKTSYNLHGVNVPGYEVTFVNKKGETRKINTAQARFSKMSFEEQFSAIQESMKTTSQVAKDKSAIANNEADTKLTNRKAAAEGITTFEGRDDMYMLDMADGTLNAMGTGVPKKGSSGEPRDAFGRTHTQRAKDRDAGRKILQDTEYGAGRTMMSDIKKMDPNGWSNAEVIVEEMVDKGMKPAKAAATARKYLEDALRKRDQGEKDPFGQAYRSYQALQAGGAKQQQPGDGINPMFK